MGELAIPDSAAPAKRRAIDDVAEIMERWLLNKSPDTVRAYAQALRAFAGWFAEHTKTKPLDPAQAVIALCGMGRRRANLVVQRWVDDQIAAGKKRPTYHGRYAALRSFNRALVRADVVEFEIEAELPRPEPPTAVERNAKYRGVPKAYVAIVEHLSAQVNAPEITDLARVGILRDLLIFRCGRELGLRRIEIHRLDMADVDLAANVVWITGKGRKRRQGVPIPSALAESLRLWMPVRREYCGGADGPLLPSLKQLGKRLERNSFNVMLNRRAEAAGVKLTPHDLRRIFCTGAIKRFGVRDALPLTRHRSILTAEIYDISQGENLAAMAEEAATA